jgi:hypothetical protein
MYEVQVRLRKTNNRPILYYHMPSEAKILKYYITLFFVLQLSNPNLRHGMGIPPVATPMRQGIYFKRLL